MDMLPETGTVDPDDFGNKETTNPEDQINYEDPPFYIVSIRSMDESADLIGNKIAVPSELEIIIDTLSALGASPVPIPAQEYYGALQVGIIDSVFLTEDRLLELGPAWFDGLGVSTFLIGEGFLGGGSAFNFIPTDFPADGVGGGSGGGEDDNSQGYSGNQSSYTLTLSPSSTTITDRRIDGDGTDTLTDIEFLDFDTDLLGAPFNLTQFGGITGLSEQNFESFIELYIAYFNRAPDAVGLNFWGTAFANGTSLEEMATLFVDQEETEAAYPPGTSNEVFAETVYNNVLGRLRYGREDLGRRRGTPRPPGSAFTGTFGTETISVPRARVENEDGKVREWRSGAAAVHGG